jgi:hypothetical protein
VTRYESAFMRAPDLAEYEEQVVRIRQRAGGEVIGGYSVVLLKSLHGSTLAAKGH